MGRADGQERLLVFNLSEQITLKTLAWERMSAFVFGRCAFFVKC